MAPALKLSFLDRDAPNEINILLQAGNKDLDIIKIRARTGQPLIQSGNALFCLGIYPASEVGTSLLIDENVDAELLNHASEITGLYRSWWPRCTPVSVTAKSSIVEHKTKPRKAACFYSGGVDSSYTVARHADELSGLITLIGADIPQSNLVGAALMERNCRDAAAAFNAEPIVVETNIRSVFHRYAGWIEFHGAALAAIAHLLSNQFSEVMIASSGDEQAWNEPWGSQPRLDPLFSSSAVKIIHDGLAPRLEKIRKIIDVPQLMENLRVCNFGAKNCGRCDKCTYAIRSLEMLNAMDLAPRFMPLGVGEGHYKIVDDAIENDMNALRNLMVEKGDKRYLEEVDAVLSIYNKNKRSIIRSIKDRLKTRMRIEKHRLRYRWDAL